MPTLEEVAWAGGFFEGEGCLSTKRDSRRRDYQYLCLSLTQVSKEPIERFAKIVGGRVLGPYGPYGTQKSAYYSWCVTGKKAQNILKVLWPWLCEARRAKFQTISFWVV